MEISEEAAVSFMEKLMHIKDFFEGPRPRAVPHLIELGFLAKNSSPEEVEKTLEELVPLLDTYSRETAEPFNHVFLAAQIYWSVPDDFRAFLLEESKSKEVLSKKLLHELDDWRAAVHEIASAEHIHQLIDFYERLRKIMELVLGESMHEDSLSEFRQIVFKELLVSPVSIESRMQRP